jgi:serine/threonine-protein kinase HipA
MKILVRAATALGRSARKQRNRFGTEITHCRTQKRVLDVWWAKRIVGQLTENQHGELSFVYEPAWLADPDTPPLSASLPKRKNAFTKRDCRPFFAGLLPEESPREAVAQLLGVSVANDFSLLDRLGGEVAGAVELLQPGTLDDAALLEVLDDLPRRPFLTGQAGLRLSLAGAQPKVPVVLVDNAVALPAPGQPTTHILKPPIERFNGTTENEAFVMRLTRAVGLNVANVEPRTVSDRKFLLIERYDRFFGADGHVYRLHQEDFCQALGRPPEKKYACDGGPAFVDCFNLLRACSKAPALDVIALLDAAIFNVIVGNADAHGKNYSILYRSGSPRLAPLYDLLCTAYYRDLSKSFAMKIGNRPTLGELDARGWEKFTDDAGMTWPFVRRRVRNIAELVEAKIESVVAEFASLKLDRAVVNDLAVLIRERSAACETTLTK